MAQIREVKNSIQMGHLADLTKVAAEISKDDKTAHVVGYILGKARGVTYRANPNGEEPSMGLVGLFEATPTMEGLPVIVSEVCFLPSAFVKSCAAVLTKGKEKEIPKKAPAKGKGITIDGVAEIELALEVGIRRSGGERGYEFSVVQRNGEAEATDAFAAMRQHMPAQIMQRAAPAMLAAPDNSKSKRKGKK